MWTKLFVTTVVLTTMANLVLTARGWNVVRFPDMMISNFLIHPESLALANFWWPAYALVHAAVELKCVKLQSHVPRRTTAPWPSRPPYNLLCHRHHRGHRR